MKQILLGSFLAALAMFIWGFIFWATPISSGAFQETDNYEEIGAALNEVLPRDGSYHVPWYGAGDEEMMRKHEAGPLATIHFRSAGAPMGSPGVMIWGFIHMLATALMLAMLLRIALPALSSYGQQVGLIVLAGVVSSFWTELSAPIWWYHPWSFALTNAFYSIVTFTLAGLVLARFIGKSKPASVLNNEAIAG